MSIFSDDVSVVGIETPTALSDRVTVLETKVEAVTVRMGTLETDLTQLATEVHDGFARVDAEFVKVRDEMQTGVRALEFQINKTGDRFEEALRESEQRMLRTTDERREQALHAAEKRIDERTQAAIKASEQRTHAALKSGDEETRRYMRTLHEDVIDRISALGNGPRT